MHVAYVVAKGFFPRHDGISPSNGASAGCRGVLVASTEGLGLCHSVGLGDFLLSAWEVVAVQ